MNTEFQLLFGFLGCLLACITIAEKRLHSVKKDIKEWSQSQFSTKTDLSELKTMFVKLATELEHIATMIGEMREVIKDLKLTDRCKGV